MRTIENIGESKVIYTFYVFLSPAERDDYFARLKTEERRNHALKLEALRSDYMKSLQTEPAFGDSAHNNYMRAVKDQFEEYHRRLGLIAEDRDASLLEADLSRTV